VVTKEYFISLGFSELYDPQLKVKRPNYLIWWNLFFPGDSITIELIYDNREWRVKEISFEGPFSKEKFAEYLKDESIDSIVRFIQTYPRNTF